MYRDSVMINIYHDGKNKRTYSLESTTLKMYSYHHNLIRVKANSLLIGGSVFFIAVIYPNIANWIEAQGLNDMATSERIILVLVGIVIGFLCFIIGRNTTLKMKYLTQIEYVKNHCDVKEITKKLEIDKIIEMAMKRREGAVVILPVIIIIGLILYYIFLLNSTFIFFVWGTLCIVLSGLLVINHENITLIKEVLELHRNKDFDSVDNSTRECNLSPNDQEDLKGSTDKKSDIRDVSSQVEEIGEAINWNDLSK